MCVAMALVGVGMALDAWLPPEPRWTREGDFHSLGFASDGKTFRTVVPSSDRGYVGPVHCWDMCSGKEIDSLLEVAGATISTLSFSDNGRMLAAITRGGGNKADVLWRVDMWTGQEHHFELPMIGVEWHLSCSPGGKSIAVQALASDNAHKSPDLLFFEAGTLQLSARVRMDKGWEWAPDGERLFFYRKDDGGGAWLRQVGRDGDTEAYLKGAGALSELTEDSRILITSARSEDSRDGADSQNAVLLWGLTALKRPGYAPERVMHNVGRFWPIVLADHRTMVISPPAPASASTLALWDLAERRTIDAASTDVAGPIRVDSIPGKDLFTVSTNVDDPSFLALYRARPLTKLWERRRPDAVIARLELVPDAAALLVGYADEQPARAGALELIDIGTGEVRLQVASERLSSFKVAGSSLVVMEYYESQPGTRGPLHAFLKSLRTMFGYDGLDNAPFDRARVFNVMRGDEIFRVDMLNIRAAEVAPDGRSLLLLQDVDSDTAPMRMICYDVPRRVSWLRVAMVPLAASVLLVLLSGGRRVLRQRRARREARRAGGS
jgi:hypothetical protein